jgi:23S rRNA (guanine2445-N2)-methyltransferase / 23S rRNA (guanine2069-N7)-methyltransferase
MKFFATTAKGMEDLLLDEIKSFYPEGAAQAVEKTRAGVAFEGTLETAYRACLWSRVANRILLPLKSFPAPTPEKLYGGVKSIKWSDHLSVDQTIAVDFQSNSSQMTHTQFGALKTKDAIVDQFMSNFGSRPNVDTKKPDIRVNVYLLNDVASVSLDLSGDSLHMRGYREEGTPAPLKENLAAAILMLADWPRVAKEGGSFIDPMCGSGTLCIEAAMIAADRAPGLDRRYYGFLKWAQHDPKVWKKLVQEAMDREITDPSKLPRIEGYDQDFRAVRAAIANVERAELRQVIHIEKRDLLETQTPVGKPGVVCMNPPYGERMGDVEELKPLYKSIGDTFKKKFKGWTGYVFTGSPDLAKVVGLQASRRLVLFNGALECRLLKYDLY